MMMMMMIKGPCTERVVLNGFLQSTRPARLDWTSSTLSRNKKSNITIHCLVGIKTRGIRPWPCLFGSTRLRRTQSPIHAYKPSGVKKPSDSSLVDSVPCPMPRPFFPHSNVIFSSRLRSGDGLADLAATLPRVQSALDSGGLLDDLGSLGEDELDVGGVGHVRVDLGAC